MRQMSKDIFHQHEEFQKDITLTVTRPIFIFKLHVIFQSIDIFKLISEIDILYRLVIFI
jgi:hypothetical protein